jgi:hypothetical protein
MVLLIHGQKELIQEQECQHRNPTNIFGFFPENVQGWKCCLLHFFAISHLANAE